MRSPGPRRPYPGPRPDRRPWEARETDAQRLHRSFPAAEAAGLLAPGEEIVAGRHPVEEALIAGRPARRLLVVPHRREALERIVLHATQLRIPIVEVEGGTLTSLAGFDGHQGIAVVVEERRFATLEDLLARAIERGEPPFVLVLDSLEDPQNLGSLLRSAEAAGAHGVIFPIRRQAPLTPAAVKASAGAVEHLLLVPVDDLAGALADLHVRGVRVVGAEADAALTQREADMRGPLALVVGHEGQGLGPAVRRRCDLLVRIPMRGRIASLNAAVAGSILLFEASGQRGEAPPPPPPASRGEVEEDDGRSESDAPDAPAAAAPEAAAPPEQPANPKRARKAKAAETPDATAAAAAATPDEPAKPKRARKAATGRAEAAAAAEEAVAAAPVPPDPDDDLLPGGPPVTAPAAGAAPAAAAKPRRAKKGEKVPKAGKAAKAAKAGRPSEAPVAKDAAAPPATPAPADPAVPAPKQKRTRKAADPRA